MGGQSWNLFNTDVSKKYKPLFAIHDPGGGGVKTMQLIAPNQFAKAGIMQADVNAKNAEEELRNRNAAAIKEVQDAQLSASAQANAALKQKQKMRTRAGAESIYTSPLGVAEQASTYRKTLLGQ